MIRALFPPTLAWSHYLALLRVQNQHARSFYEIEAAREAWSVRELERQIAALLFERLAMNLDKTEILELARQGQIVTVPTDVIKDPFVLEFLDLRETPTGHEQAIIDRLEEFLLEKAERDEISRMKLGVAQGVTQVARRSSTRPSTQP